MKHMLKQQVSVPFSSAALGCAAEMLQAPTSRAGGSGHSAQLFRLQPSSDVEFGG